MRKRQQRVTVQAPPVREIRKPRSCVKWFCCGGCLIIIVLGIAAFLILQLALKPRPKQMKRLPEVFPQEIPIYDKEHIARVILEAGEEKSHLIEAATFAPKVLLSPLLVQLERRFDVKVMASSTPNDPTSWADIVRLIKTPVGDYRDTYRIEWNDLGAEAKFIYGFYKNMLIEAGYTVETIEATRNLYQFTFSNDTMDAQVRIYDNPRTKTTDSVVMIVHTPHRD